MKNKNAAIKVPNKYISDCKYWSARWRLFISTISADKVVNEPQKPTANNNLFCSTRMLVADSEEKLKTSWKIIPIKKQPITLERNVPISARE